MKLSVLMATYDRWLPYFKSILSVKPAILKGSEIKLGIKADSKLNWFLYLIKSLVTKILLLDCQYSISRGGDHIGLTRDMLISNCGTEYFMFLDDDDYLVPSNLELILTELSNRENVDIVSFDYYLKSRSFRQFIEYTKWNWIPKYWFGKSDGLSMGIHSIVATRLYESLPKEYKYFRLCVDDMLPNHVMYLEADYILKFDGQVVVRDRGEESLMNSTHLLKYCEIVQSLEEFRDYLNKRLVADKDDIWKISLTNQIKYHEQKSGTAFAKLIHGYFQYEKLWTE